MLTNISIHRRNKPPQGSLGRKGTSRHPPPARSGAFPQAAIEECPIFCKVSPSPVPLTSWVQRPTSWYPGKPCRTSLRSTQAQ